MSFKTNTNPRVLVGPLSERPSEVSEDGTIYVSGSEIAAWNSETSDWVEGSGGGITPGQHELLRQLIHLADGVGGPMDGWPSGTYRETLPPGSPFPTLITWWTSAAKVAKIVQKDIVFDANKNPTQIKWSVYDAAGSTVLASVTDNITYYGTGPFELSRTRTIFP